MAKLRLIKNDSSPRPKKPCGKWRILVVDDDPAIHTTTHMALKSLNFHDRTIEVLVAHSAAEARKILREEENIAIIFLDVVMETELAGLQLVRYVRGELGNHNIRIIMRTGQPGNAPEEDVVLRYGISDYKSKTELTVQKLFSSTVTALRTYEQLRMLDTQRIGLQQIIEACGALQEEDSLHYFTSGVLTQLGYFLNVGGNGILCTRIYNGDIQVMAASGSYGKLSGLAWSNLPIKGSVRNLIATTFETKCNCYRNQCTLLYLSQGSNPDIVVFMDCSPPPPNIRKLIELFCAKITTNFSNLYRCKKLQQENALLRQKLEECSPNLCEVEPLSD